MQASNVIIDPKLLSGKLSDKRKRELREARVIELITSKPSGARIKHSEFAAVTGMTANNMTRFLQRMEARKLITIEKLSPFETTYSVVGEAQTTKPRTEWKTVDPHEHKPSVVDLAMRFYWETNSDSLHEFVTWIEGKEG